MEATEREWEIKMRRIRAQQENDFLASVNRSFLQKFIDSVDISLAIRHWKLRWQYRFIRIQGEYIRRNKPERVVYVAKLGESRRWAQYRHEYIVHTFFENNLSHSEHFENIITPLVQKFLNTTKINKCTLVRAKANLFIKSVVNFKNNLHKDQDNKNYVNLIYYVNNNNGYTEFEDGTKINSVANRALIFDNNILHRSVNQTDEKVRINFNLNITPNIFLK
jgi:AraC-like DNA-binding protein